MTQPSPGWYHAEGDPPDTVRYWDGELWQGEAVRDPSAAPSPPPAPSGYGAGQPYRQPFTTMYPEASQATTALVLGIVGLVCCGLAGPFAWKIGQDEITAIDVGRRDPTNRGTAVAGKVTGIIGTVFLALGVLWIVLFMAAGVTV